MGASNESSPQEVQLCLGLEQEITGLLPEELGSIRKKQEHDYPSFLLTGVTQVICQKDRAQVSNTSFKLR